MGANASTQCFTGIIHDYKHIAALVAAKPAPDDPEWWKELLTTNIQLPVTIFDSEPKEFDPKLKTLCQDIVRNDLTSQNFVKLLERAKVYLKDTVKQFKDAVEKAATQGTDSDEPAPAIDAIPVPVETLHSIILIRIFSQHMIETLDHYNLCLHFGVPAPPPPPETPGEDDPVYEPTSPPGPDTTLFQLVQEMCNAIVDLPFTDLTHVLHVELLTTLLVLVSTEPFLPMWGPNIVSDMMMLYPDSFRSQALLCKLISNYAAQHKGESDEDGGGLWKAIGSAASAILLLPWSALSFFFPARTDTPMADRSLMLALALVFCPRDANTQSNPYLLMMKVLQDSHGAGADEESSAVCRVSYTKVFDALVSRLDDERVTLFFYSMIHYNADFLAYVLARTDLDILILPLTQALYDSTSKRKNHVYMLLIISLILTEDAAFNGQLHSTPTASPSWFAERVMNDLTLGSLLSVCLIRTMKENLIKSGDVYMHTNALAVLANMAAFTKNMHSYACEGVFMTFKMLSKRMTVLQKRASSEAAVVDRSVQEQLDGETQVHVDFLRIILEIVNACLTSNLPENLNLVHHLLLADKIFSPYMKHPRLQDVLENLEFVRTFFESKTTNTMEELTSEEDVMAILEEHARVWKPEQLAQFPDLKFRYEQEENPEDFFVPYCWALIINHAGVHWDKSRMQLLPPEENEFDMYGVPEDEVEDGTATETTPAQQEQV
eukprot:GFYU01002715.1.p1 GENE.GFYU01002715.1~~GFYU01002715.1.p1  ORF type:complete len:719 (-),score=191.50 GFYU01002715.1:170-2326(-)